MLSYLQSEFSAMELSQSDYDLTEAVKKFRFRIIPKVLRLIVVLLFCVVLCLVVYLCCVAAYGKVCVGITAPAHRGIHGW